MIKLTNKPNETADLIAEYVQDTSTLEKSRLTKMCVAFTGVNCNTMFGGLRHNKHGNNAFAKLKKTLKHSIDWSRLSSTCFKQLYLS